MLLTCWVEGPLCDPISVGCGPVSAVAVSPNGNLIASASSEDSTIYLHAWDGRHLEAVSRTSSEHNSHILSITFSPDGTRLASCSQDKFIRVWDAETRVLIESGRSEFALQSVAFSPTGPYIAFGSTGKTVGIWDMTRSPGDEGFRYFAGQHADRVNSVVFSPDGRRVASASGDGAMYIWDVESGVVVQRITPYKGIVTSVAYSPDGKYVVSGFGDGKVGVWRVQTIADSEDDSEPIRFLRGHMAPVNCVAFSRDNKFIVSGSDDLNIRLWHTDTWQETGCNFSLPNRSSRVLSVAFFPDSRTLVSGHGHGKLTVWDVDGEY